MAKRELHRMEIEPAENGGHTVTHHYKESMKPGKPSLSVAYHEPESHVFGEHEGHEMLGHVAHHLGIKPMKMEETEKDGEESAERTEEEEHGED